MRTLLLALALLLVACGSWEPAQPPVETDTGVDAPADVDASEVAVPFDGRAKDRPAPEDRPDVPQGRDMVEVVTHDVFVADTPDAADVYDAPPVDVVACRPGRADCDGTSGTPCEVNAISDPANCGGCGIRCGAGEVCARGRCAPSCAMGDEMCRGWCIDVARDTLNCGGCGINCGPVAVCRNGLCARQ